MTFGKILKLIITFIQKLRFPITDFYIGNYTKQVFFLGGLFLITKSAIVCNYLCYKDCIFKGNFFEKLTNQKNTF